MGNEGNICPITQNWCKYCVDFGHFEDAFEDIILKRSRFCLLALRYTIDMGECPHFSKKQASFNDKEPLADDRSYSSRLEDGFELLRMSELDK